MPNPVRNISTSMKVKQEQWDAIFQKLEEPKLEVVKRKGGRVAYRFKRELTDDREDDRQRS